MNTPLIQVRDLSHRFPDGSLGLDGVSADIYSGDFIVLAGSNGSGKTLLMRHLNALARPSSGDVLLRGISVSKDPALSRRSIGLVFQDADSQIVGETVERDVAFGPRNLKLDEDEISLRVKESLRLTGLEGLEQRRPHSLSGGEKRRLSVAGVLAMHVEVLVLDEPFTGLDWPGSADLIEVLLALHAQGVTILLITHDLDKVLAHANRLLLMSHGRILEDDHPRVLLDKLEALGLRCPHGSLSQMTWRGTVD